MNKVSEDNRERKFSRDLNHEMKVEIKFAKGVEKEITKE